MTAQFQIRRDARDGLLFTSRLQVAVEDLHNLPRAGSDGRAGNRWRHEEIEGTGACGGSLCKLPVTSDQ